ncbi:hypothetical protein, conserved in T. vivax [Trypanosoma vivax Y486]|uniref:Uncharacterized protein n=1 Tax=Trypanosoma vivax (strain Y486) TaxID=1055687 RepID=F9WM54_TRYVY|nr:hypothetical protein, conserved in T. vivax [Trypanosoma vivax Y486]|eukprot:CCD18605.1 hypothetical protein, conserved in T. vivax [Trypanosoma vivax Y486]
MQLAHGDAAAHCLRDACSGCATAHESSNRQVANCIRPTCETLWQRGRAQRNENQKWHTTGQHARTETKGVDRHANKRHQKKGRRKAKEKTTEKEHSTETLNTTRGKRRSNTGTQQLASRKRTTSLADRAECGPTRTRRQTRCTHTCHSHKEGASTACARQGHGTAGVPADARERRASHTQLKRTHLANNQRHASTWHHDATKKPCHERGEDGHTQETSQQGRRAHARQHKGRLKRTEHPR